MSGSLLYHGQLFFGQNTVSVDDVFQSDSCCGKGAGNPLQVIAYFYFLSIVRCYCYNQGLLFDGDIVLNGILNQQLQ